MASSKDDRWFESVKVALHGKYLSSEDPRHQSGFSGTEERWISLRKPVADCITRSGTFLDIGCANGYLAECVVRWCQERGIEIEPYGIDISERLITLARQRFAATEDRFQVANGLYWQPGRSFDFVRTELLYVPREEQANYLRHLLSSVVAQDGLLLVANYLEDWEDTNGRVDEGAEAVTDILLHLSRLGFPAIGHRDGFDPIKGRKTRVALLRPS